MTTLLVATNGSPTSRQAEDEAIARAQDTAQPVVFLYVTDASFIRDIARYSITPGDAEDDLEHIGRIILERAARKARDAGVEYTTMLAEGGPLAERIHHVVEAVDASTVYVGRSELGLLEHHRSGLDLTDLREDAGFDVRVVG